MDTSKLTLPELIACIEALIIVLNQRKHRRLVLGEEVTVAGSLSKALKLPQLLKQLHSPQVARQQSAHAQFNAVWITLSASTKNQVLETCNWYDTKTLNWDDPRSNRKPNIAVTNPNNIE